jgi:superfamily II DNA or RNA helicase
MILDNQNENPKVYEWIEENTQLGELDLVTGYFTIGALAFLSEKVNERISKFRFVIGDIVASSDQKIKSLDLLNQNIDYKTVMKLTNWAKEAAQFLKQAKVECKTLEPNFCHAKLYLTKSDKNNPIQEYYIMGSSNLTEAGIGLKANQNVELNSAGTGTESTYRELKNWFQDLWDKPQARFEKTIKTSEGKQVKVDFKQYLIDEISKIFHVYNPIDIYHLILNELFGSEEDPDFQRELGRLENSLIYRKLFSFQQTGVVNLIKILNKYNGAILADAVGLGKTWSTLAVIKYYQLKGRETILLCPKKLEQNWKQFKKRQHSIFEEDAFDYEMNFHTDFTDKNLSSGKINFEYINSPKPKLIVIDESHNLRNDKSIKYRIIVDEILKKNQGDVKVLLLSATPINNQFTDVRNQFALLTKGDNRGFEESLEVKSLEFTFREVQARFNKWNQLKIQSLSDFYQSIHQSDFFKLTEHLVVARTRKNIKNHFDANFHFPKVAKPENIFKTPLKLGDFDDLPDLMEKLQLNLSAYQPSQFTLTMEEVNQKNIEKANKKKAKNEVLKDNLQREYFLVKMMKILMLKRLESSWIAFKITLENIYNHHENALKKIKEYQNTKDKFLDLEDDNDVDFDDDDLLDLLENINVGKKNPIKLKEIDEAGRLDDFKDAIKKDKENLLIVKNNLVDFEAEFLEDSRKDIKLKELIKIIDKKKTEKNPKIVIFTAYKDTAVYLFEQLKDQGHSKLGLVFGNDSHHSDIDKKVDIQRLLQHFAPYTKLFLEKKWDKFALEKKKENFEEWKEWLINAEPKIHEIISKPVDILITTDVLSEGQNLQDADLLINYDIHWNPVRVIQRFGRIDRIGSPNDLIKCINFWPADSINAYINLKGRVEARMAVMQFIGSEVIQDFTEEFSQLAQNPMEDRQTENLLKQMNSSISELDAEGSMGFDDFSFDIFKQQLLEFNRENLRDVEKYPNGIFSGYKLETTEAEKEGVICFFGVLPKKDTQYTDYRMVYLNKEGGIETDNNKVILEVLSKHRNDIRVVDPAVDAGDPEAINRLQNLVNGWVDSQNTSKIENDLGEEITVAGQNQLDLVKQLQQGKKKVIEAHKNHEVQLEKQYDLITWMLVS